MCMGRTDQSKVTEVQITTKDFASPSAATQATQEVEAETTRFFQGYRCRGMAAQLLGNGP
jgi:hypothetical protein